MMFLYLSAVASPSGDAQAAWLANGTPVRDASFRSTPFPVSVAPTAAGGAYVVSGDAIFESRLTRLTAAGDAAPGWPSDGVRYSVVPYWPYAPVALADDEAGAFVVSTAQFCEAHCAGNGTEYRVQRTTAIGERAAGWPEEGVSIGSDGGRMLTRGSVSSPVVIANGHGGVIATWAIPQQCVYLRTCRYGLIAQLVDGSGAKPWGPAGITIRSLAAGTFAQAMAPDGSGGVYVFWLDERAPGLYAQHVSESGVALWAAEGIPVAAAPSTFAVRPVAIPDGAHGAIVAWAGTLAGRAGVFAARVTPSGSRPWRARGEVFSSGSLPIDGLRMVPALAGGAVIAWRIALPGTDDRLLAQRINHAGLREWPDAGASVCAAAGSRDHMTLASDSRGGA